MHLTWLEISGKALHHNIQTLRSLVGLERVLGVAVKGNAYGHGMVECSKVFAEAGVDYLCVNSFEEAQKLRQANIGSPVLIMGYVPLENLEEAVTLGCDLIVYNPENIQVLAKIKDNFKGKDKVNIHLKIETGNHRQGVELSDLPQIIQLIKAQKNLHLKGISTHFANIEDRVHQEYAQYQLGRFNEALRLLKKKGLEPEYKHCANSAATLILPEAHFNFVRVGIAAYGLWPSEKTKRAASVEIKLQPSLTWKTLVAQVKEVKKGELIGYGCTYKMPENGKIAVLPVGYYEGFDRGLSNKGVVLIHGKRAPVVGRVCMNMIMVDVSHIPNVQPKDEVVLIGKQEKEEVTAEEVAELLGTINYEVVTRINPELPRKFLS